MKKIFFLFLSFLSFSLIFCMIKPMDEQTMKKYMQQAKEEEKHNNMPEALKLYAKVAIIDIPDIPPYYGGPRPVDFYKNQRVLHTKAINKIGQEVARLKQLGKYNEALKVYQYAPQIFSNQIAALKKIMPFENQIKQALQFVSKKNFTQAYTLLDNPELNNLPDIIKLKMSIRAQEEVWKTKQAQKAAEQKEWIFLRTIDLPDKEKNDWRIKDKDLELNTKAADVITAYPFVDLIATATIIPYILIGLRDDNDFYYFFDGSLLPDLYEKGKNPITNAPP